MTARLLEAAVFAAALALFALSVCDGRLALDDWGNIYGCAFVKDGLSWSNVGAALTTIGQGGMWMPVTHISFMADISLLGGGWRVHHAVNAVLHAVNAVLVMHFLLVLLRRFLPEGRTDARRWCALAALVWALGPQRADAVAWVVSRKEELWTAFALLGLMSWCGWLERGGRLRLAAAFALFVLSCLSKPTAMCFPVLAWLVRRFARHDADRPRPRWKFAAAYAPMFAFSAFVALVAVASHVRPEGMGRADISVPLSWSALNAAVSLGLYILHAVFPVGVYADYRSVVGGTPVGTIPGLVALAAALATLVVAARARSKEVRRAAWLSSLFFLFALLPTLGLVGGISDNSMAERYTYLPSVGLAFAAAFAMASLAPLIGAGRTVSAALLVAAANAACAAPVVLSYADDVASATRTLRFDPDHWRAIRTIGCDLAARHGKIDEGVSMMKRSLALRPSQQTADVLAYTLACRGAEGDFAEVRRLGAAALAKPALDRGGMMLDALAIAAMREGDDETAAKCFSAAIVAPARTHSNAHSLLNLGLAFANLGKKANAVMTLSSLVNSKDEGLRRRAAEALEEMRSGKAGRFPYYDNPVAGEGRTDGESAR